MNQNKYAENIGYYFPKRSLKRQYNMYGILSDLDPQANMFT